MKFYLTKSAQLAAEGRAPKAKSKKEATVKAPKSTESIAEPPVVTPLPLVESAQLVNAETAPSRSRAVKSEKAAKPGKAPKPTRAAAQKQPKSAVSLGAAPRVDLLPQEVRAERRASQNVRRAWLGVVGVAVVVGIGFGTATLASIHAQENLVASQAETSSLSAEQAKYGKVKTIENETSLIAAAQQVGGSTDIDWNSYLTKLQATLPSNTTIKSVNVDSASAITPYVQSSAALQGVRIGTINVTVVSPTLPSVPTLLNGLATLPGYVDANPGTVTAADGGYTANIVMHINQRAYSGLYTSKGK